MISENSLMQMQPNEMDIVRIPDELPIYDVDLIMTCLMKKINQNI